MHDIIREPLWVKWLINENDRQNHNGLPTSSYPKIIIRITFTK